MAYIILYYIMNQLPAPTEMAASLRVPRKLCSFLFFLRVISSISTPGHLRFHYIQSRRTTEYKISVNSPSVRPRICFSRRESCVLPFKTGQRNGSHAATQKNDSEKEGNEAVFWSDSRDGHTVHHSLAFFLPMSSLLTTRLMKSEQG